MFKRNQDASGKLCIRVTTGSEKANDGYLSVMVDEGKGKGFALQPSGTEGRLWQKGETVLDECFDNVVAVRAPQH